MNFNNIDLSGIKRFKRSLNKMVATTQSKDKTPLKEEIGSLAFKKISEKYIGTRFKVLEPVFNEKNIIIYAKGYGISFDEFGTGFYAIGTYKGDLPKQPITFPTIIGRDDDGEAIKGHMTTQGWVYYYPNPNTKDFVNGELGWWVGSNLGFQVGRVASNRFYDACQEIKEEIKERRK